MSFWTAVVVIVAIIAFANIRMAKYGRHGRLGSHADASPPQDDGYARELEREIIELKKRLEVLERIATDERESKRLAHEIESLRDS